MSEICNKCGLPKEICACEGISKEQAKVTIKMEKRRYGKPVTIVEGLENNVREISKILKSKLACGGTCKDGVIELQGDHKEKAREVLVSHGFPDNTIDVL